jgi:hypothetical protein
MPNETTTYAPTGAVAIARRPEPAALPTKSEMEVMIDYASTISDAAACLPDGYRKQPGAVLLAREWANAHGVDLLTAIQTVAFVKGKPVVDAAMQRALAKRAGYRLAITMENDSATVTVSDSTGVLGQVTYTMADANAAGLAGKDNWKKHPREMLVAAASRLALRWHAPDVLLGVWDEDEIDDQGGAAVAPLAPAPEAPADVVDAEIVPGGPIGDPFTAVGVPESEPEPAPAADAVDETELRAQLKAEKVSLSTFIPAVQLVAKGRGLATVSTLAEACALGEGVIAEALESLRT